MLQQDHVRRWRAAAVLVVIEAMTDLDATALGKDEMIVHGLLWMQMEGERDAGSAVRLHRVLELLAQIRLLNLVAELPVNLEHNWPSMTSQHIKSGTERPSPAWLPEINDVVHPFNGRGMAWHELRTSDQLCSFALNLDLPRDTETGVLIVELALKETCGRALGFAQAMMPAKG